MNPALHLKVALPESGPCGKLLEFVSPRTGLASEVERSQASVWCWGGGPSPLRRQGGLH